MDNNKLLIVGAIGAGLLYMLNKDKQQAQAPQQTYAPQQPQTTYYPPQQPTYQQLQPSTFDRVLNVVGNGLDIWSSYRKPVATTSYIPPVTPTITPTGGGIYAPTTVPRY